jgi:hypothetical protein
MKPLTIRLALVGVAIGLMLVAVLLRGDKPTAVEPVATAPEPSTPVPMDSRDDPPPPRAAPRQPAKAAAPNVPSEVTLMQMLRDLSGSNPALSLKLAREGQEKYQDSPEAAERQWYIVRSLMDLSRVDEARAEARRLIDRHPTSSWAEDVHRHLFVNPPGDPAERGYGKRTELGD